MKESTAAAVAKKLYKSALANDDVTEALNRLADTYLNSRGDKAQDRAAKYLERMTSKARKSFAKVSKYLTLLEERL
jgi:hypothetical protein